MEVEYQAPDPMDSDHNTLHHYKPYEASQTPSFEFKIIYIRLATTSLQTMRQTSFTLNFLPRDAHTCLQINGIEADPAEPTTRRLNKHREDMVLSEAVYVNTDRIKFIGKCLGFEVNMEGSPIVKGVLRMRSSEEEEEGIEWVLECREGEGAGETMAGGFVDVYCAGRSLGEVVLLNQVVELKGLKQGECLQLAKAGSPNKDLYAKYTELMQHKSHDEDGEMVLEEEDELTWFNAGVKLGIGLGVGMSLGVGVGVGIFMKSYNTSSARMLKKLLL